MMLLTLLSIRPIRIVEQWRQFPRLVNNYYRLRSCHVIVRNRVNAIISDMEQMGFQPWVRDTWRSVGAQQLAFDLGRSDLQFGFHNTTDSHEHASSFAVDLAEFEGRQRSSPYYSVVLARLAARQGMITGIRWGLSRDELEVVESVITGKPPTKEYAVGWDPCHIEPFDIPLAEAIKLSKLE